jgi:anti-sigma regulatory factor (Ser/Thr protein kinase)
MVLLWYKGHGRVFFMNGDIQVDQAVFKAELEELNFMMDWIRKQAEKMRFSKTDLRKLELASEEALVNVISYAYNEIKEQKGGIEISCRLYPEERIEFVIKDKGAPFNPLLHSQKVDRLADLEDRMEGGLGILFIQQYMDEVHYERQHPYNILTLIKKKRVRTTYMYGIAPNFHNRHWLIIEQFSDKFLFNFWISTHFQLAFLSWVDNLFGMQYAMGFLLLNFGD